MTTTLLAAEQALSKELGDYWSSTTTGAGTSTTLVDTELKAKANDWITDEAYSFLVEEPAGSAAIYDERKISSLDNTTGTLTTLAFAAAPGTGIDYEVHRLFSPSEKRRALVASARNIYPALFNEIWDESLVCGNWLKNGSVEKWTLTTTPDDWTVTTVTAAESTTSPYYKHGAGSCKLSGSSGTLAQAVTNFDDLKFLAGKTVTFTAQGWCDTADSLRLSINDGTTQTYSSYITDLSAWTQNNPRNDSFYVQQTIDDNPTQITFTVHYTTGGTAAYVDDLRAISDYRSRLYIGHLGLAQNRPHGVFIEPSYYSNEESWTRISDYKLDSDGYLYVPTTYQSDRRLRIRGIGYLDFLASGASSTAWTATIDINEPQLKILTAEAILYLYTQMSLPNYESGTREEYQKMLGFWKQEVADRKAKFGMKSPAAAVHWGLR